MKPNTIISFVHEGDIIPFDGTVVEGFAIVDESAQTGVSTPVVLDSEGPDRQNQALAGTLVIEGSMKIESPIDARSRDDIPPIKTLRQVREAKALACERAHPILSTEAEYRPKKNTVVRAAILLLLLALALSALYTSKWAHTNVLSNENTNTTHVAAPSGSSVRLNS